MNVERFARFIVMALAVGLPVAALVVNGSGPDQTIDLHGRMAESGGWLPADLTAKVGEPIRLRLTSDDVMHGFAIGQSGVPAIDVKPGQVTETRLEFDRPGKYTFYCTRWCGPNHWRMRGAIEVIGSGENPVADAKPLYVTLGLDIDAPHPAAVVPERRPSAARGAALGIALPAKYLSLDYHRTHSPTEVWTALHAEPLAHDLDDAQVWDLVALAWRSSTTPETLAIGRQLFSGQCAACHGEAGAGDGVMADVLTRQSDSGDVEWHDPPAPADFTAAESMLGASPALLHGKIVRGGMGSGMPYFGPIFTEDQTWSLVDYLWTFQFQMEEVP